MYCELKNEQYWVWSSRVASLDCLPQYKIKGVDSVNDALLSVCAIKQLSAQKKARFSRLEKQKIYYREVTIPKKEIGNPLYKWAIKLNDQG